MGNWCLLDKPNIELIDETPKGSEYNYLRPEGIIIYSLDRMYDVPKERLILTVGINVQLGFGQKIRK